MTLNKYLLLLFLEPRASIYQFPDLGGSHGNLSPKWTWPTTCVVVEETPWTGSFGPSEYTSKRPLNKIENVVYLYVCPISKPNGLFFSIFFKSLCTLVNIRTKRLTDRSPWFTPRPTFGVVLLPIVALLKCGDMEGVVFFRGKVSLR